MFEMNPLFPDAELIVIERLRAHFPDHIVADKVPNNVRTADGVKLITVNHTGGFDISDVRESITLTVRIWDYDKDLASDAARAVEHAMKDRDKVNVLPILTVRTTMKPQDFTEDSGFMYRATYTLTVRGT